ncbi:MAG: RING finger protein [Eubacterium sp.]
MPSYENQTCPVCGKDFTADDDIVTCPICGTPHHRECYKSLGHCANEDKHNADFSFTPSESTASQQDSNENQTDESKENNNQYYYTPPKEDKNEKTKCVKCGEEIDKDAPFCNKCGERQPSPQYKEYKSPIDFGFGNMPEMKTGYENSEESIDGKSVSEIASVVRTNTKKFIPKFIKNKKTSWNWGAFFFGPFYLFFRKMYKEGTIFLAIRLIVALVVQGLYAQPFADFSRYVASNYDKIISEPSEDVVNQLTGLYEKIIPMMLIIMGANIIIHVVIALFSDRMYRSRVISILSNVDSKLDDGGMFNQTFSMMDTETNLSQKDMKKLYLGKVGGTSIFAPVIAYLIYDLITSFISNL